MLIHMVTVECCTHYDKRMGENQTGDFKYGISGDELKNDSSNTSIIFTKAIADDLYLILMIIFHSRQFLSMFILFWEAKCKQKFIMKFT